MGVRVVCEVRLWVGSRENVTRPEERTELLDGIIGGQRDRTK